MQKYIWRGKIVDKTEVNIDLQDRGYQFGDGLYEVVHMYNGNFFTIDEHINRLFRGATQILLNIKMSQEEIKESATMVLKCIKTKNRFCPRLRFQRFEVHQNTIQASQARQYQTGAGKCVM